MTMAVCFCALILSQSFSQLARLLVLPLHLLPQHLVGVLQEEDPQPQLILPHPPRVPRLLGRQVVLPSPLPGLVWAREGTVVTLSLLGVSGAGQLVLVVA